MLRRLSITLALAFANVPGLDVARGPFVEVERTRDPVELDGVVVESVSVESSDGVAVHFRVLRPGGAGPFPTLVLMGGHRTGRDAVELVGNPGDVAVLALDYPYAGPEKVRGLGQSLSILPEVRRAIQGTPAAAMLATDWLTRQPWVDTARLELVGVSLGTPFAAATGALDDRFRRVWLIHGGADNHAWLRQNLAREIDQPWLRSGVASLLLAIVDGGDFDTAARAANIAPRPVVIIGARDDERLEPANVEALYAAAQEPKTLIWTDTNHIEPDRPEVVHQLLELVLGRVGEP